MIFLDLDETLVFTHPMMRDREGCQSFVMDDGEYHTVRRPLAWRLIRKCREIAETRILTMGTKDYAEEVNRLLNLGFESEHIIGRDNFLTEKKAGWGFVSTELVAKGICPDAVLVDNQTPDEPFADLKMRYLGINPERYIKISTFTGKDHRGAEKEIEKIICQIKSLKS